MAFTKKGWRRIVVGEQVFYWSLGFRDPWDAFADATAAGGPFRPRENLCVIRPESGPHRRLLVHCGYEVMGYRGEKLVTPRVVRGFVEFALARGWPGEQPGLELDAVDDSGCLIDPVQRPIVQDHPEWRTPTVMALARGITKDHAFDRFPVLADALEEAGCDDERILSRCRRPEPVSRGWWVLDLLLTPR